MKVQVAINSGALKLNSWTKGTDKAKNDVNFAFTSGLESTI